jgi:hypothetical protein
MLGIRIKFLHEHQEEEDVVNDRRDAQMEAALAQCIINIHKDAEKKRIRRAEIVEDQGFKERRSILNPQDARFAKLDGERTSNLSPGIVETGPVPRALYRSTRTVRKKLADGTIKTYVYPANNTDVVAGRVM